MPTLCKHWLYDMGIKLKGRKTWQLGYAAGLIDADGCITIGRHNKTIKDSNYTDYSMVVVVNQTDGRAIDFMYGTFGGNLYRRNSKADCRPFLYRWEMKGYKAATFLKRLIPFLRIKRDQAELAIQFQTIRHKGGMNRFTGTHDKTRCEELYQRMKNLKKLCLPSAAAETKWRDSRKREAIVQA